MAPRTKRTNNTGDQDLTQLSQAQLNHFRRQFSSHLSDGLASTNVAENSLLEKCLSEQNNNQRQIDDIAQRIASLINRLQGHSVGANGMQADDGDMAKDIGVLGEHQAALKYEGQRLGEIQCDLAVLEALL